MQKYYISTPSAEKIEIPTVLSFLYKTLKIEPQLWLWCLDGSFFICLQGLKTSQMINNFEKNYWDYAKLTKL